MNFPKKIENLCRIAKVRFYKFRGMDKKTFYLHLKKCEFRFNHRQNNIYILYKNIGNRPLSVVLTLAKY